MPRPDFSFPLDDPGGDYAEYTRRLRDQPEQSHRRDVPLDAIVKIAGRIPPGAVVFGDEAYAEFAGISFIPELDAYPNVIVGRTFSKAFGLAGLRIGCLVGAPDTVDAVRRAIPVYSVNIAAAVAIVAALDDLDFLNAYLQQVTEWKHLLYAACDRLGLSYVPSQSNFVLVRAGDKLDALVTGALAKGIYLRDRSTEPGCAGCLRIATGIVEHTRRAIAVMEEVLCAAR